MPLALRSAFGFVGDKVLIIGPRRGRPLGVYELHPPEVGRLFIECEFGNGEAGQRGGALDIEYAGIVLVPEQPASGSWRGWSRPPDC